MLASASVMALASFGLLPQLLYESCVVTSVFWRMQAHSELILNASWCGFEQVRLSVALSRGCAAHASRL